MCNGDSQGKIPHSLMLILLLYKARVTERYNYYKKAHSRTKKALQTTQIKKGPFLRHIFCNLKTNFWAMADLQ